MKKLSLIPATIVLVWLLINVAGSTGCANILSPEGGKRDSIPPMLEKVTPPDSSKKFDSKEISFTFDEFVQVNDITKNLLISPLLKNTPVVNTKLRTVTLKIKDTLAPNTTYSINFGNAITDINEGNQLKNFTYVFTTGNYFDSLTLVGKVILAETGKIDSTLSVILHKSGDDSAVVKERPMYAAKLDGQGNFIFEHLPAGKFYLYALGDQSGSYRYFGGKDLFAFADKPVNTTEPNDSIVLYAFREKEGALPIQVGPRARNNQNNAAERRLRPVMNTSGGQDLLSDLVISFDQPLKKIDTALIHFSSDTTFNPIIAGYRILLDSTKKRISLQYQWKENTQYNLIVDKEFAEDTVGKKLLKTDTFSFKTKKLSEYGSLKIRFKNVDLSKNPVLLFFQGETLVKAVPLTSSELFVPIFPPGDFEPRVLFDRNKNGKWDTGEFFGKHIQPEIVKPLDRKSITVKGNWDNEFDIAF